jgi:tetratricopeptide (TPR) repeat protein
MNVLKKEGIVSAEQTLNKTQMEMVQKQVRSSLNEEYYRESLFNLARVFDWAGKYEETKHLLNKSLDLYGDQGKVYFILGTTLLKNGEIAESIATFQKAIKMGYETPMLYLRLADAYREEGRFKDAFEAYKNKLRLDGLKHEAHMLYGILYAFQGDHKSALTNFREALRLKPDFLPASINMVGSLCVEQRYEEAMELAKKILKQDPNQYKMYFAIGEILLERGDREGAIQYLSKALRIAPEFKKAKESLARAQQMESE